MIWWNQSNRSTVRRQWIFRLLILPDILQINMMWQQEESIDRANERVKKSTERAFAETVIGYETVTAENTSVQFHGGKARYALYPVWLLNTTWNGNRYTFAMNGQTGKFVGDLPVDKAAATRWTLILAAVFTAVTYGAATLLHLFGLF